MFRSVPEAELLCWFFDAGDRHTALSSPNNKVFCFPTVSFHKKNKPLTSLRNNSSFQIWLKFISKFKRYKV